MCIFRSATKVNYQKVRRTKSVEYHGILIELWNVSIPFYSVVLSLYNDVSAQDQIYHRNKVERPTLGMSSVWTAVVVVSTVL